MFQRSTNLQLQLRQRRTYLLGAVLAVASCAVSAQGGHEAYLKSLYDKALASGESTLVIYNPFTAPNKVVYEEFEKQFPGIKIRGVEMFGPQLISRIEAEAATGRMQTDLLYVNAADALALHKLGRLSNFVPETARGLPAQYVGLNQQWSDWALTVGGIYYNKTRVKPAEAPKGYADLLDAKWRGRVTTVTFRVPGGAAQGVTALVRDKAVGEDWIHKFAANKPFVVATSLATVPAVVSGQADVGLDIPYNFFLNAQRSGAPLDFVFPKEGSFSLPLGLSVPANARNADLGRLFMAWAFTPQAQAALARMGMQSTMPNAPRPADAPQGHPLHILYWRDTEALLPNQMKIYQSIFPN